MTKQLKKKELDELVKKVETLSRELKLLMDEGGSYIEMAIKDTLLEGRCQKCWNKVIDGRCWGCFESDPY